MITRFSIIIQSHQIDDYRKYVYIVRVTVIVTVALAITVIIEIFKT